MKLSLVSMTQGEKCEGSITRQSRCFLHSPFNTWHSKEFKKSDGFASSTVTVLDPAAGTLTFWQRQLNLPWMNLFQNTGREVKKDS
jgi:hypothetical protein